MRRTVYRMLAVWLALMLLAGALGCGSQQSDTSTKKDTSMASKKVDR